MLFFHYVCIVFPYSLFFFLPAGNMLQQYFSFSFKCFQFAYIVVCCRQVKVVQDATEFEKEYPLMAAVNRAAKGRSLWTGGGVDSWHCGPRQLQSITSGRNTSYRMKVKIWFMVLDKAQWTANTTKSKQSTMNILQYPYFTCRLQMD